MKYNPLEWNHMMIRKDLLPCPFCGYDANQEERGNLERQHRIICGNPHCEIEPHTRSEYDIEDAVESWQLRRSAK